MNDAQHEANVNAWVDALYGTRAELRRTPWWQWKKRRALRSIIISIKSNGFAYLYGAGPNRLPW